MIGKLPLKFVLIALAFFTSSLAVSAQVSLREISLKEQVENSSLVLEGKVIGSKSFWDADYRMIYTANTVEVYKVFKGDTAETIEVLTLGGAVGMDAMIASNTLKLREGDIGVFTLYDNNVSLNSKNITKNRLLKAYSGLQGFYKYNLQHNVALNPFKIKQGVKSSFYNEIMSHTKSKYVKVVEFDVDELSQKLNKSNSLMALGITDFTPTTTTAGTASKIIINGTDFGSVKGKVGFANADSGGISMGMPDYIDALDSQVTSWTDSQIEVQVPSSAGTGKIRITHDDTSTIESAIDLTITYAQLNIETDVGTGLQAFETQHYGDNGSGYTWEMQTNFFNETEPGISPTGYKDAFMRAFDSWRCETKINWEVDDEETGVDVIGVADLVEPFDGELDADGTNVIRFDNGSELETGVLGRCTSWYSGRICSGNLILYVTDIDIVFDNGTSWYFGTGDITDKFDFETVALHELGHGHQLGHVINSSNVMHYTLGDEDVNTVLDANSISAANNVQSRSTTNQVCGMPVISLMTDYAGTCGLSVEENEYGSGIKMYPNPTKQQFFVKNNTSVNLERIAIYDVSGRLVSDIDVSGTSRTKTINLVNVSKGLYFVNIHSENDSITRKLIVD